MALITVLVVFPFIWMLVLSFKSNSEILSTPLSLPKSINFDNYKHAMDVLDFPKLYGNTIFVCVISLVIELVITFFSSFAISRMEFKNEKMRKLLYGFLIMGLSISPFILLFPVYKINVFFGLRGKMALILPYVAVRIRCTLKRFPQDFLPYKKLGHSRSFLSTRSVQCACSPD